MSGLHIRLSKRQVAPDRIPNRVSQHHLQRIGVPAIPQKIDGERTPETMRMRFGNSSSLRNPADELTQTASVKWLAFGCNE